MSGLDRIPVIVESRTDAARPRGPHDRSHASPILSEIRHALERLLATGEETRIDLNSLPFGPGELDRLTALLGTGEVNATVEALGPTHVQETAIPGVWLVDYRNSEAQRLTLHIEIAPVPEILRPQPQDLAGAIATLDARLDQGTGDPPHQS